jgi:ascorbate-specific PTS system EIIC-type component UlaA
MTSSRQIARKAALVVALLALAGCSNLNHQEQSMLTGGAAGTVIGAGATVLTGGCVACGAAIGGAVGVGTGYVVDKMNH